jgi:hypothetical protein
LAGLTNSGGAGAPAVQLVNRSAGVIRAQETDNGFDLALWADKAFTSLASNECLAI